MALLLHVDARARVALGAAAGLDAAPRRAAEDVTALVEVESFGAHLFFGFVLDWAGSEELAAARVQVTNKCVEWRLCNWFCVWFCVGRAVWWWVGLWTTEWVVQCVVWI